VQTVPELLDPLPEAVRLVFSSGITTGGISAFVLNAVLPSQPREVAVNGSTGATAEPLSARPSEESPLQISSWSCTAHATTAIGYRLQVAGCKLGVAGWEVAGCVLLATTSIPRRILGYFRAPQGPEPPMRWATSNPQLATRNLVVRVKLVPSSRSALVIERYGK